jgi:tetratricopeptide (TPR) repeat protein
MKTKTVVAVMMWAIVIASPVCAQELLVEYIDGILEVRDGEQWYELFIGESVSRGDLIRLADHSYAELSAPGITLKLSEPGTYDTESMVGQAQRQSAAGVGDFLSTRLKSFGVDRRAHGTGTVGGVRGSEAVNEAETVWVGGQSVEELIAEGIERLAEEDYQDAYWVFDEAYDYADEVDEHRAGFYLGYSAALTGETEEALDLLAEPGPDPDSVYFTDHVIVLSQVYVETFAYQKALNLLHMYESRVVPDQETQQLLLLLKGTSLQGLNREVEAQRTLARAVELDPNSEAAAAARSMLGQ